MVFGGRDERVSTAERVGMTPFRDWSIKTKLYLLASGAVLVASGMISGVMLYSDSQLMRDNKLTDGQIVEEIRGIMNK